MIVILTVIIKKLRRKNKISWSIKVYKLGIYNFNLLVVQYKTLSFLFIFSDPSAVYLKENKYINILLKEPKFTWLNVILIDNLTFCLSTSINNTLEVKKTSKFLTRSMLKNASNICLFSAKVDKSTIKNSARF